MPEVHGGGIDEFKVVHRMFPLKAVRVFKKSFLRCFEIGAVDVLSSTSFCLRLFT